MTLEMLPHSSLQSFLLGARGAWGCAEVAAAPHGESPVIFSHPVLF